MSADEWARWWRRTLDGIGRVDRARAAGGDVGLPLAERVALARRARPGDRVGPPGMAGAA